MRAKYRRRCVKLRFKHKVFLIFLLNSLVIVICMILIGSYFAYRNFEEYVTKVEKARLDEFSDVLSRKYRESGGWPPVLDDLGQWLEAMAMVSGQRPGTVIPHNRIFLPPPPEPAGNPPSFGEPPPPPPGPPPPPSAGVPRIALFDAEKRPLTGGDAGLSPDEYWTKAVTVDDQVVGWLGIRKPRGPSHPLDVEFLRRQSQTLFSIGAIALFLALLVTFILTRHILGPVNELAEGARALTSRRFETRIKVRSRDELGQLAADFNNMAQALERYEQMRRQWIADISHELRTPLAVLRGEIEAMQDGVREITPEALDSLSFEVLHVGRIVHDLHDLSLIESQAFDAERTAVDPLEVLEDVLKFFHTRFEQRGISIDAEERNRELLTVMADAGRLRQLYANLLENTLRYANAPGVLKISREVKSGVLTLHFEDSGPGVPAEALGRLFDRLYRVDKARSRAKGGSGLGLAICRSIVESFGGRIEAINAPSGGLRITIDFPALSA
jgi:two-component system sensor histidine kinase BaeS